LIKILHQKLFQSKKIKNFFIYGFGQAINLISPLLVIPYIVSICAKDGLGKIGVGFSFALIFNVLIDYGSYINGTKEISINRDNSEILRKKIASIYVMKFFLLLFFAMVAFLIVQFVPFFNKEAAVFYFSFLCVVGQFINPTWIFQGTESYKWISFVNILSKFIYVVCIFVFIKKSNDYIYANAYLGLGLIIASLVGLLVIINQYKLKFYSGISSDAILLIKEEFSLTFSQLFLSFYQYLPIILISAIGGNTMAGQYRIIDQILTVFRTYLQMFFNFVYADVCLQFHRSLKDGFKPWLKYNGLNYILIVVLASTVFIFTNKILLFFKLHASELDIMGGYLKIGLLIPIFMGITFALKQLILALNKNKEYIRITIGTTFLSLGLLYFLVNRIGLEGAFITTICIEIIVIILYYFVLKPIFSFNK